MDIPKLNRSTRSREYNSYQQIIIDNIVYDYLFNGLSHRKLDEKYTHMDPSYSRGYQSMGILHYLGIGKDFKGIFHNKNLADVIIELENQKDNDYLQIINILRNVSLLQYEELNNKPYYSNDNKTLEPYEYTSNKEGKKVVYYTNRYERNPRNRALAIALFGCKCMVCKFDFESMYGSLGKGFIEVHHIKPLSDLNEEVEICPATDLVTVCSNCHRMIHREKDRTLSVEELKKIIINTP